jgi:hypothetical protein
MAKRDASVECARTILEQLTLQYVEVPADDDDDNTDTDDEAFERLNLHKETYYDACCDGVTEDHPSIQLVTKLHTTIVRLRERNQRLQNKNILLTRLLSEALGNNSAPL